MGRQVVGVEEDYSAVKLLTYRVETPIGIVSRVAGRIDVTGPSDDQPNN